MEYRVKKYIDEGFSPERLSVESRDDYEKLVLLSENFEVPDETALEFDEKVANEILSILDAENKIQSESQPAEQIFIQGQYPEPSGESIQIPLWDDKNRNQKIRELLKRNGNNRSLYSKEELLTLAYYTGDVKKEKGQFKDGWYWDFYTPDEVVKSMWQLAYKNGFVALESTSILEPSCGVGRFLRYAPSICNVKAYEIDETSHLIASLLYPMFDVVKDSFESHFYYKTGINSFDNRLDWDKYDLVIGNPPYKFPYTSIYDKKERNIYPEIQSFEQEFIVRGIDALKPGGILVYILPSTLIDNEMSFMPFKELLSKKCKMVEAYRLPEKTFEDTTITTDIVVFKKFSDEQ